ncbi:hypothetical protein Tco_0412881 [Tanacetum coccineum]
MVGGSEVRKKGSETREESSSKRARDELEHEKEKKPKVDDDKEREELQQCFKIVTEEDVAIDAIPLLIKSFDREDFETLWRLVKANHRNTMLIPLE